MKRIVRCVAALLVLVSVASCHATRTRPDSVPTVRLGLEDAPRAGRPAPPLIARYATAAGIGPVEQPFDLTKELGNIVVIAFVPGVRAREDSTLWWTFQQRHDSLFGAGVVVVGVAADSLTALEQFARGLELPFKLLADPEMRVLRRFAAADGKQIRRTAVVVGRDGRVRYVDPQFAPLDPKSYDHLAAAIATAKERP